MSIVIVVQVQPNPIPLQQYISEVRTTNVRLKVVQVASAGDRVFPGDSVKLDGRHVKWQALNSTTGSSKERHVYIKYWKPRGVTCTTDRTIKGNVIDEVCAPTLLHCQFYVPHWKGLACSCDVHRVPVSCLSSCANRCECWVCHTDWETRTNLSCWPP